MNKTVFITGINGQDGAYLAQTLLKKKYKVYGLIRRTSNLKIQRLDFLGINKKINFLHGELNEHKLIEEFIKTIKPNYIYNLAAQSFVQYSFENPEYTLKTNTDAVLNMLEVIRRNKINTRFYQASTSEMFGNNKCKLQNEESQFCPVSPYGISKVAAHALVKMYRESFSIFACSGILFNHESPLRGVEFVTKKIINQLVNIKKNNNLKPVILGNIYAQRDWGYAKDYTDAMIMILNNKIPKDYIVSTGKTYSVKDFFINSSRLIGFEPVFEGNNLKEVCYDKKSGKVLLKIDKKYLRKNELHRLIGDSSLIKKELGWRSKTNFQQLVKIMVNAEMDQNFKNFHLSFNSL
jgi:GDPmannose 4,6-dehydratase